jgi:CheY-like chemotaxis protein
MGIWGCRVVAVDDDRDALASLDALLRERGAELVAVDHAGSALATVIGVIPDVLLVAMAMPGLDGIGLLRKLRSLSPERGGQIPAAAVSAGPSTKLDRTSWAAAGFQRHVEKPFVAEAVVAVLGELAGHFVERRVSSLERRQWPTPHDRRAERRIEHMTLARVVEGDLCRPGLADGELR